MTQKVSLYQDEITTTIYYHTGTNWEDQRCPAHSINLTGLANDPTRDQYSNALLFSGTAKNSIYGTFQIPHSWREGSCILPHIHWQSTHTDIGNVAWMFEYDIASLWTSFVGVNYQTGITDTTNGDINYHHITDLPPVNSCKYKLSSIIKWKLSRLGANALDTYNHDVALLEFDIHYEIGTVGSGETFQK